MPTTPITDAPDAGSVSLDALMEHDDAGVALAAERLREHARRVQARANQPEFLIARRLYEEGWWTHHANFKNEPRPAVDTLGHRNEKEGSADCRHIPRDSRLDFVRAVWAAIHSTAGVSLADLNGDSLERVLDHLEDLDKEQMYGPAWHLGRARAV